MSRDYKSRKSNSAASKTSGSLIMGLFIGYALGLVSAIGIWMYISQAPTPFLANEEISSASQSAKNETGKSSNESQSIAALQESNLEENEKFDFYKILPGADESFFEQATEPDPPPQPTIPKNNPIVEQQQASPSKILSKQHYFLQAGSFRSNGEAENLKARLAFLGVVAAVRSADLGENGTWHRVRIGPFDKKDEVDQIRTSLQQNGIETQFIKTD